MPKLGRRFPRLAPLVAVAIVFVAGACGGSSEPSTQAASSGGLKQVCDAGAKEGKLVYWNNLAAA